MLKADRLGQKEEQAGGGITAAVPAASASSIANPVTSDQLRSASKLAGLPVRSIPMRPRPESSR
jgi:hypothetical protein